MPLGAADTCRAALVAALLFMFDAYAAIAAAPQALVQVAGRQCQAVLLADGFLHLPAHCLGTMPAEAVKIFWPQSGVIESATSLISGQRATEQASDYGNLSDDWARLGIKKAVKHQPMPLPATVNNGALLLLRWHHHAGKGWQLQELPCHHLGMMAIADLLRHDCPTQDSDSGAAIYQYTPRGWQLLGQHLGVDAVGGIARAVAPQQFSSD